jgi:hypothetical protein
MRYKPTFILLDLNEKEGMHSMYKIFVEKKGFEIDLLRTIVVKYPYILGKSEEHIEKYFSLLGEKGFTE